MDYYLRVVAGLALLIGILFAFSSNRRAIDWKLVGKGILLQFVLALAILHLSWVSSAFDAVGKGFVALLGYTREGSLFLFGDLVGRVDTFGYLFAFQVLPTIIFFVICFLCNPVLCALSLLDVNEKDICKSLVF